MKKRIIAILLALSLTLIIARPYKQKAYADAMTASMLGSVAYAIMRSTGISFTAGNATGAGMDSFMTGQIESYVNSRGGSLSSVFGGEMARLAAGKLVVGQQMYNGILGFIDWMKNKFTGKDISYGEVNGEFIEGSMNSGGAEIGTGQEFYFGDLSIYEWGGCYGTVYVKEIDGTVKRVGGSNNVWGYSGKWQIGSVDQYNRLLVNSQQLRRSDGTEYGWAAFAINLPSEYEKTNTLEWSFPVNWEDPSPLPQNKQWEGDFSGTPGWAEPQDLPDFLSRVPTAIAENNLVVQQEIGDTGGTPPTPTPNPSPSPSPTPYPGLSIAEKIALILGEITAIMFDTKGDTAEQTYQDIAQEIEQTTEGIAESITEPITQTQTQTQQQIIDSTQTITDTITQTQTQTQEQLQDITQTQTQTQEQLQDITQTITDTQTETQEKLEDITQKIEDATSVPDQTSWDKVKKDLHGVFPFCIPWDIYGMLNAFNAEPRAPHFEYPFKIPRINLDYTLELDFEDFDPVAQTLRTVELIAFCVGLAILTSKVIRW